MPTARTVGRGNRSPTSPCILNVSDSQDISAPNDAHDIWCDIPNTVRTVCVRPYIRHTQVGFGWFAEQPYVVFVLEHVR